MTIARSRQISLQDTPYYHVVSRCVRRAFLCGEDAHSGQSYEHRRQWVVDKLGQLSRLFAIGICAYAVMSNHYHLVLKVDPDTAANWSEREVAERWAALFQWPLLVRRWYQGEVLSEPELAVVQQLLAQWRERLHSISWFIRLLMKIWPVRPIRKMVARAISGRDASRARLCSPNLPYWPVWRMLTSIRYAPHWQIGQSRVTTPVSNSALTSLLLLRFCHHCYCRLPARGSLKNCPVPSPTT